MVEISDNGSLNKSMSIAQFKLIIRLRKQYTVDYVLKYVIGNLITIYCYMYSKFLYTVEECCLELHGISKNIWIMDGM